MPNYTKLFNSIITSTIWSEDDKTRIIWITMLAMSDKNGEVHASIPGLARVSSMTIQEAESAIGKLMSPDPYSRTPDNEGRRIAKIDGGWELLNHGKYRLMASKEDAKSATAERVKRHRLRNADVTQCNADVTVGRDIAEAEADSKKEKKPRKKAISVELPLPYESQQFAQAWQSWLDFNKEKNKPMPLTTIRLQLAKLKRFGEAGAIQSIEASMESNYAGLFEPKQIKNPSGTRPISQASEMRPLF